jgi:hypothetical protein
MQPMGGTRRVWLMLICVVLALGVIWFAFKAQAWLAVDRCLDSGGAWDAETHQCRP